MCPETAQPGGLIVIACFAMLLTSVIGTKEGLSCIGNVVDHQIKEVCNTECFAFVLNFLSTCNVGHLGVCEID